MTTSTLQQDLIVVDGLNVSSWSRQVFEDMRKGGVTAANCTCSIWENFQATMDNIAQWKRMLHENGDILLQVKTTADIERAKKEGKTGIILGFQNVSAFEDRLGYIQLFKEL
ncbi:MAG: membrane dipeptidase, partial [Planctomycetota bacterium]